MKNNFWNSYYLLEEEHSALQKKFTMESLKAKREISQSGVVNSNSWGLEISFW